MALPVLEPLTTSPALILSAFSDADTFPPTALILPLLPLLDLEWQHIFKQQN